MPLLVYCGGGRLIAFAARRCKVEGQPRVGPRRSADTFGGASKRLQLSCARPTDINHHQGIIEQCSSR